MAECSYCGTVIKPGSGKMFVRDNGQVLRFCKSKCEKNMLKLKRDARKFKWTKFFEKGAAPNTSVKKAAAKKVVAEKKPISAKKAAPAKK
jgi:large subunit ribosomal protein L24e